VVLREKEREGYLIFHPFGKNQFWYSTSSARSRKPPPTGV
jgi:chlorite dismutase